VLVEQPGGDRAGGVGQQGGGDFALADLGSAMHQATGIPSEW
jgi:hypothetical protein